MDDATEDLKQVGVENWREKAKNRQNQASVLSKTGAKTRPTVVNVNVFYRTSSKKQAITTVSLGLKMKTRVLESTLPKFK